MDSSPWRNRVQINWEQSPFFQLFPPQGGNPDAGPDLSQSQACSERPPGLLRKGNCGWVRGWGVGGTGSRTNLYLGKRLLTKEKLGFL